MFKCPQNAMLGSAESAPIFLVKKFSFLRLKIGRWFTKMTLKRKQKKHVYKNLIKSAIQQEWPSYALITLSSIYLPYTKKKTPNFSSFFFSNRVSVIWAFLCAIHCKLTGRLSSDDVIWVVPGRFVVFELFVDVANSLNGVWHLQTADCRLQTADCRLQNADCRLQTADYWLQTTDYRMYTMDLSS